MGSIDVRANVDPHAYGNRVRVTTVFERSVFPEARAQCESFLNSLVRLVAIGAFGPSRDRTVAVEAPPVTPDSSSEATFFVTMPRVHPAVWRVLVGGLAARTARSIVIDDAGARGRLGWRDLLRLPRLKAPRDVRFRIEDVVNPNRAERLVQLTFRNPLSDPLVADVRAILAAWNALLEGGFPLDDAAPGETVASAVTPYAADRFTLETRVSEADHDDEAYEVLLNAATAVDATLVPLEAIIIE